MEAEKPKPPFKGRMAPPGECAYCDKERANPSTQSPMPSHTASEHCKSGGRNHCSCDTCY